jgi:ABC-2 type transport system permease protein
MPRYWKVYRSFFLSSLRRELEFRANFAAKIAQSLIWIFFFLAALLVIYGKTDSIAGWNKGDAFILAATVFVMNAVATAFFSSLTEIPAQVRLGTLDFVVTKPIDSQFWISTRKFNFDQIGTLVAGLAMIIIGVGLSHHAVDFLQALAYSILVIASLALYYSFQLALMTTGVWLVRVDNLWVLGESIMQVARYPLDIYNTGLQRFLTFVVPIGFLATVPASQLVKGFDPILLGVGIAWAIGSLYLSRRFWHLAMRHYGSASS